VASWVTAGSSVLEASAISKDHKKTTTVVLLMLAFVCLLMLAVFASIRHPFSANQFQIEVPVQQLG
jgi:hypothetical protein